MPGNASRKKTRLIYCIIIPVAVLIIAFTVVGLVSNPQIPFVIGERFGFFTEKVEMKLTTLDTQKVALEALRNDSRVVFNQSLMLINTKHMLDKEFVPETSEYKDSGVLMSDCMQSAYSVLSQAVAEQFRTNLYVSSSFRTQDQQAALYAEDPSTATAVGASEHQSGLALDVYVSHRAGSGFLKSPAGRYINAHSWEYGFILRYPSYGEKSTGIRFEPWHIRYVGSPHAAAIYNNHLTLEEYIEFFQIGEWYQIDEYFVSRQSAEDGNLMLPSEYTSCVISPDNTGCYIITLY